MKSFADNIKLDFRSTEPLYLQIARQIEQLVSSGYLQVGDQLPTVRELALELRINFNTVARAYHVLDEARLISTQRGRGTYIWEEPTEEMKKTLRAQTLEELAKKFIQASRELGYSESEVIETLTSLVTSGDLTPADDPQATK